MVEGLFMDSSSPIIFLTKKSPKQKKEELIKAPTPEPDLLDSMVGFEKSNYVEFLENIFQDVLNARKIDREDKNR